MDSENLSNMYFLISGAKRGNGAQILVRRAPNIRAVNPLSVSLLKCETKHLCYLNIGRTCYNDCRVI